MKKELAIELLGGTPKKAAAAMGYRSIQAVYLWPAELPQATSDRVRGVLSRTAATLPSESAPITQPPISDLEHQPCLLATQTFDQVTTTQGINHG